MPPSEPLQTKKTHNHSLSSSKSQETVLFLVRSLKLLTEILTSQGAGSDAGDPKLAELLLEKMFSFSGLAS